MRIFAALVAATALVAACGGAASRLPVVRARAAAAAPLSRAADGSVVLLVRGAKGPACARFVESTPGTARALVREQTFACRKASYTLAYDERPGGIAVTAANIRYDGKGQTHCGKERGELTIYAGAAECERALIEGALPVHVGDCTDAALRESVDGPLGIIPDAELEPLAARIHERALLYIVAQEQNDVVCTEWRLAPADATGTRGELERTFTDHGKKVTRSYGFEFNRACRSFSTSGMTERRDGPKGTSASGTSDCGTGGAIDAVTMEYVDLAGQRLYFTRTACETGRAATRRGGHTSYVIPKDGC